MPRSADLSTAARFGGPLVPPPWRRPLPVPPARRTTRPQRPRPARRCGWALGGLVAVLAAAPAARAEQVVTTQASAARATASTWIAAPVRRAAVCLVDSGVTPNPDTANVVARLDVTGSDGGDASAQGHGTLMAMIASAPYDGFGMVGAAPSVDVVSVRAMAAGGGETFSVGDFTAAINTCITHRVAYDIKVVSLSLGGQWSAALSGGSVALVQNAVDNARLRGLNVVAAAGNQPGPVDWPAAYGPVLAVGAGTDAGARCAFAASGPGLDLWTAGCPQDVALPDGRAAWATGSSGATAFAAAVLAQLRGLRPDLGVDAAEQLLLASAAPGVAGPVLDVDAAFTAAGLAAQLAQGRGAIPLQAAPSTAAPQPAATAGVHAPVPEPPSSIESVPGLQPHPTTASVPRLPRPRVRAVRLRRGMLTWTFVGKPAGIRAHIEVFVRKKGIPFPVRARILRVRGDRVRTRVSGAVSQVSMTYRDPARLRGESPALTLRP